MTTDEKELYERIKIDPEEDHKLIMNICFKKMLRKYDANVKLTENEEIMEKIAVYMLPHCSIEELKYLRALINKQLIQRVKTKEEVIEDLGR